MEACAQRELLEETGLRIKAEQILYIGELILPDEHLLDVMVLAKRIGGSPSRGKDKGVKALRFVPLKELNRIDFLPREIGKRFEKDWKAGFPEGIVHLGRYRD